MSDKLFDNPNTFTELSSPNVQPYVYGYESPPAIAINTTQYLQHRSGPYSFAPEISVLWDTVKRSDRSLAGMQGTIGTVGYSRYQNSSTVTLDLYGTSGLKSTGKVVLDSNFFLGQAGIYYSNPWGNGFLLDIYYFEYLRRVAMQLAVSMSKTYPFTHKMFLKRELLTWKMFSQDAEDIATFTRRIFDALPGTGITPLTFHNLTQAQIAQYITTPSAYAFEQVNHWSSSCRIVTCADTNTAVIGTKNIHVVDGSIVAPLTVNPQMEIMIAAERAAELIKTLG